ncbi:hypothetical protein [Novosphingobium sp. HR1a]|uniref:hypothetical protein n=1 Tax=Novosphingobium sp. HR1a TaxID=1395637 RepID=UPI0012EACA5C|nr:hypothetical protein [Novosphingobium sp. HR1a]
MASAAILLAGCNSSAPSNVDSPSTDKTDAPQEFSFRDLVPGKTSYNQALEIKAVYACSDGIDGGHSCMFAKNEVAGITARGSDVIFRKDGKLDWFSIKIDPSDYDEILRVIRPIYGDPCLEEHKTLQNAFGATFAGDEMRWCFSQGNLSFRRHAKDNATRGEFEFFVRDDSPPSPVPTTASEL